MAYKILVADDEKEIRDLLRLYLEKDGYQVLEAEDGRSAISILEQEEIDMALLDIMMPEIDGLTLCRKIRERYTYPVIMLTARDGETDKITGLTLGADDYVTKPFRPRELIARIKAALRKSGQSSAAFELCGLYVDTAGGIVRKDGKEVFLSALEYRLLLVFISNPSNVITRDRLLNELWDAAGEFVTNNTLTVYIKRLREKIEDDPANPEIILTVRGTGYRLGAEHA